MLDVYTDGSCLGNPGPGGAVAVCPEFEVTYGHCDTTNNRMEMYAVIIALEQCLASGELCVTIHTDSSYVKNGIESWMKKWKTNGWKTSTGGPVKNKDLWIRLSVLSERIVDLKWVWVKGHSGDEWNEKADRLAVKISNVMNKKDET